MQVALIVENNTPLRDSNGHYIQPDSYVNEQTTNSIYVDATTLPFYYTSTVEAGA